MTDLERAIKAGCEARECVYPTCIASDGTLCRQHQRYLLAALAAIDPPSDAVVEAAARAIAIIDYDQDLWERMVETDADYAKLRSWERDDFPTGTHEQYRISARAAIRAYLAAIRGVE